MTSTTIYILKLQGGRYYVGKTDNVYKRYAEHVEGKGAAWTRRWKPVAIEAAIEGASPFDEDRYVKEYMARYGRHMVRGGAYVTEQLDELQNYMLQRELWGVKDRCTGCGSARHFVEECPSISNSMISVKNVYKESVSLLRNLWFRNVPSSEEKGESAPCIKCMREDYPLTYCYGRYLHLCRNCVVHRFGELREEYDVAKDIDKTVALCMIKDD